MWDKPPASDAPSGEWDHPFRKRNHFRGRWAERECGEDSNLRARFVNRTHPQRPYLPGEEVEIVFRFRNEGSDPWPEGVVLLPVGKNDDHEHLGTAGRSIPVPGPVASGALVDVAVPIRAPLGGGKYVGFWRLATKDHTKFGQRVGVKVFVDGSQTGGMDWMALIKQLETMGWTDKPKNIRLLSYFGGDIQRVIESLVNETNTNQD